MVAFESSSGDYRTTLRNVAQDENPELRERALSVLAQLKDGFAQKKLLEGLQNPEKALVPPEKALQQSDQLDGSDSVWRQHDVCRGPDLAEERRPHEDARLG